MKKKKDWTKDLPLDPEMQALFLTEAEPKKKKTLTPEEQSFPLLDGFGKVLIYQENKAPNTIRAYETDVRLFCRWLLLDKDLVDPVEDAEVDTLPVDAVDGELLKTVRPADLERFLDWTIVRRGMKPASHGRMASSLKRFFGFLYRTEQLIAYNPAADLRRPTLKPYEPKPLTLRQTQALLQATRQAPVLPDTGSYEDDDAREKALAEETFLQLRDLALVTLFLNTGLRLSEASALDLVDIQEDRLLAGPRGRKRRTVFLNEDTRAAIAAYRSVRDGRTIKQGHEKALFLSARGRRIADRTIERRIDRLLALAKLDTMDYSVHSLRHTAAALMHQLGGVSIPDLQQILGHIALQTTQAYATAKIQETGGGEIENPLAGFEIPPGDQQKERDA